MNNPNIHSNLQPYLPNLHPYIGVCRFADIHGEVDKISAQTIGNHTFYSHKSTSNLHNVCKNPFKLTVDLLKLTRHIDMPFCRFARLLTYKITLLYRQLIFKLRSDKI